MSEMKLHLQVLVDSEKFATDNNSESLSGKFATASGKVSDSDFRTILEWGQGLEVCPQNGVV